MTMWWPDTCECQIEVSDGPPEYTQPAGTPVRHIKVCARHKSTTLDHHGVLGENQNKNRVVNAVAEQHPAHFPTPAHVPWSFDAANKLTVTIPKALAANAEHVHGIANAAGKAEIAVSAV